MEHTGPRLPPHGSEARPRGQPLITVAICTRNRSSALRNAAASVLSQIDDDTELLIVDNDSTDDTLQVATALAGQHSCVAVCQEKVRGIAAARNTALSRGRGEFILFFDDDELAEPGWLKAYREFLLRHDRARIGCVGGG